MKKFIVRFLIWMSVPLALAFGADYMISSGLQKTDIRKYAVWNDIYADSINADMVILGSSQAWSSYNTFIFDSLLGVNSYNLGIDGHSIEYQLIRYEMYRRYNQKPSMILFNACYIGTFSNADGAYDREQFFPYLDDEVLIPIVAKTKKITWLDRHIPLIRYFGYRQDVEDGISACFGNTVFLEGGLYKGFRGNDCPWIAKGIPEDINETIVVDPKRIELLEQFADNCHDEKVKLVFVKYPVCFPVVEMVRNLRETDSIFETIADSYSIPILDYYYSDITKDSTNYYNYTHLNKKGAELFTIELCHDLDSLGILDETYGK